jgi:hypothetical protein
LTSEKIYAIIKTLKEVIKMKDFDWNDKLWCVVKADGNFAGVPCLSADEARELSCQHEGSCIYSMYPIFKE